ncbi:hypothetical protein [Pendulispora albinea]|uniref:Uncharacterized protein n=1 Tax=Pendulispora albinea TaxID=2741071 RepID=A0ABZ2M741_9BACT
MRRSLSIQVRAGFVVALIFLQFRFDRRSAASGLGAFLLCGDTRAIRSADFGFIIGQDA